MKYAGDLGGISAAGVLACTCARRGCGLISLSGLSASQTHGGSVAFGAAAHRNSFPPPGRAGWNSCCGVTGGRCGCCSIAVPGVRRTLALCLSPSVTHSFTPKPPQLPAIFTAYSVILSSPAISKWKWWTGNLYGNGIQVYQRLYAQAPWTALVLICGSSFLENILYGNSCSVVWLWFIHQREVFFFFSMTLVGTTVHYIAIICPVRLHWGIQITVWNGVRATPHSWKV